MKLITILLASLIVANLPFTIEAILLGQPIAILVANVIVVSLFDIAIIKISARKGGRSLGLSAIIGPALAFLAVVADFVVVLAILGVPFEYLGVSLFLAFGFVGPFYPYAYVALLTLAFFSVLSSQGASRYKRFRGQLKTRRKAIYRSQTEDKTRVY